MFRSVRGGTQSQILHLSRPASVHNIYTDDLSQKPVQHQSLPDSRQALPYRISQRGTRSHWLFIQAFQRYPQHSRST